MLSPLVREGISIRDISDFADAIEKVVENIIDLKNSNLNKATTTEVYDALKAIDENVK
jgi:hypothetical protein